MTRTLIKIRYIQNLEKGLILIEPGEGWGPIYPGEGLEHNITGDLDLEFKYTEGLERVGFIIF